MSDTEKKNAIIIDLDGTLCNIEHRLPLISNPDKKENNWKAFYTKMVDDTLNEWCHTLVELYADAGISILYVTGRPDIYKDITLNWLRQRSCPINGLYMRKSTDSRKDDIVKKEIYENQIKNQYDVLMCIEDRKSVTDMWRSLGLICLQCGEGNF